MRFVPESMKVPEPKAVITEERGHLTSQLVYPTPSPIDWADEQYEQYDEYEGETDPDQS